MQNAQKSRNINDFPIVLKPAESIIFFEIPLIYAQFLVFWCSNTSKLQQWRSTSANVSGEPAAQNYSDIAPEILEAVDYVCWSRRQEHKPHQPSSIIKLKEDGQVTIIRK